MYIWKIDHHETNKYYGMHAVTYVTDDLDIPAFVTIISNDLERANQERFGVTRLDMKPRDEDDLDQLLDTYGFNDNYHPDRSASALYFYFLLTTGMLDNLKFGVLTNLVKVVYHISAYDTFEFDKLNPRLPFVSEHPDALTVLWKSFHGKFME